MGFLPGLLAAIGTFVSANAPALTAAATIAGTGVSVGETLANQPGGGGGAQQQPVQPPQAAPSPTTNPALASLVAQQSPNAQAQVGGSLAPPAFSQLVASLTGNPGDQGGVQNILFGGQGNQGLTDLLAQISPAPAQSLTTPSGGG